MNGNKERETIYTKRYASLQSLAVLIKTVLPPPQPRCCCYRFLCLSRRLLSHGRQDAVNHRRSACESAFVDELDRSLPSARLEDVVLQ